MVESMLLAQQKQDKYIKQLAHKVDVVTTHNKMLEAQIVQQGSYTSSPLGGLLSKPKLNPREQGNDMILRGVNKFQGPKGVDDVNLHDENDILKKEVFSPSNDVHDTVVKDTNEVPMDPKHTFLKPYTQPLPFL